MKGRSKILLGVITLYILIFPVSKLKCCFHKRLIFFSVSGVVLHKTEDLFRVIRTLFSDATTTIN